jgi:hypothetical protein
VVFLFDVGQLINIYSADRENGPGLEGVAVRGSENKLLLLA